MGRRLDESDVIQTTWLDIVSRLDQFNGSTEGEFFAWLKKILENNVKNAMRNNMADKRDVRKELNLVDDMESAAINWFEPIATGSSPSNRLINGESALSLAAAIESLPDNQRIAIELRHLQGMKLSQVCEIMEKTPDAVVSLIRRGMIRLREILSDSVFSS